MGTATIYNDSAINIANLLPPESVQTVVTSPPYYGPRIFVLAQQVSSLLLRRRCDCGAGGHHGPAQNNLSPDWRQDDGSGRSGTGTE